MVVSLTGLLPRLALLFTWSVLYAGQWELCAWPHENKVSGQAADLQAVTEQGGEQWRGHRVLSGELGSRRRGTHS